MDYFTFQWHITDSCDQRCEHCYIFSENNDIALTSMSLPEMRRVLDDITTMCDEIGRLPYIYLTGGDPILHENFWDLLELLHERDIRFAIMGNPFHLTDEICQRLHDYGCVKYQLSIDGLRETHDAIRMPGSFDTTLQKIGCIKNAGMKCAIMTTVSGTNIEEIPALVDLVVAHQVDIFAFARYCPTSLEKDIHIEPRRYRDLLSTCWRKYQEYGDCGTSFNLKDHLWTLFLYEEGIFTIADDLDDDVIYEGCNCGINHMTILPDGDICACRRMESTVGNAFDTSLLDTFLGDKMDAYRQFEKLEKCSHCELLRFCRGCPAVAYGRTHDHCAADPQCWKEILSERKSIAS